MDILIFIIVMIPVFAIFGVPMFFIFRLRFSREIENEKHAKMRANLDDKVEYYRNRYDEALSTLRANPNNPELRQLALSKGRQYAQLTREDGKVAIYDEVAISNDLNAACGGSSKIKAMPMFESKSDKSSQVTERLETLKNLYDKGLISDDEYNQKRRDILTEV